MKEICLDEGTIQAFLDGELSDPQMDAATGHIALCDTCALLLATAEEESAFAYSAIDGDLNTLVPTQRLWSKINDSIVEEKRQNSFWYNFKIFLANLSRPSAAAFASLLIVFGVSTALLVSRPDTGDFTASELQSGASPLTASTSAKLPDSPSENFPPVRETAPESIAAPPAVTLTDSRPPVSKNENFSVIKADYRKPVRQPESNPVVRNTKRIAPQPSVAASAQYLPGEETYIRTIANLSETVNSQKDAVLKPSARFAYEKDMAFINSAIDKMKAEVKKNPKNDAAKEILFASYQNKINLLNSVTERTELMASIR